ncbi:hypothetical protein [Paracoccus pacificus]|uniref:Uncharacterized protein n=1 Tax=Paracoccus pacificus TaxID=1463598 RepID=A0ABW4R4U6_9RHOB
MLILLIASGGMMQHGRKAQAADIPGNHVMAAMTDPGMLAPADHHNPQQKRRAVMPDACVIICLGTPTPWAAAAQLAPVETERSLRWRFTAVTLEGRFVGPGYRPPKSV